MKLKKLLEGMAWERTPGQPLPTLKDVAKAHALKEAEGPEANNTGEFDYDYFIKQFDSVQEVMETTEYELLQTLDGLAEDDDVYGLVSDKAEQAANQIRRYINGAYKQLEGIQNLLERHKRNKDLDQ
tara:strand:+ start:1390 stop:1770 length:381 start_codon:yes stop_codon:yes gene_type:complete